MRFAISDLAGNCCLLNAPGPASLQVDTVATTLTLAEQNHAEELKRVAMEFACKQLAAVMATEGYQHMVTSCPQLQVRVLFCFVALMQLQGLCAAHKEVAAILYFVGSAGSAQLTEFLRLVICRRTCCGQWQSCQNGLGACTATVEKGSGTRVTGHAITLVILLQRMKGAACVSALVSRCLPPLL